jgi:steroid delta-isomerase-like uncharacterized protein
MVPHAAAREHRHMSLEHNKAFVCAVLDAAFNHGDLDVLNRHFSPDATIHDPQVELRGSAELRGGVARLRLAFPDFRFDIDDILAEGDRIAIRYRGMGTHQSEFLGVPATGRHTEYSGMLMLELRDGKIVQFWAQPDQLGLLKQLGHTCTPS